MSVSPEGTREPVWFAKYPSFVPKHLEIPSVTLHGLLEISARQWPNRTAILYYGRRWSYAELWELTGRIAAGFRRDGLSPGDRVALYLPNGPAYPFAFFGALRAGLSVVQVSPLYVGDDLVRPLKDCGARALVTLEILYPNVAAVESALDLPLRYVARLREFYPLPSRWFVNLVARRRGLPTGFPSGPAVRPFGALTTPGEAPVVPLDPATAVAVFQYTGGTTGKPKAALLTHRNLVANALQCLAWFGIQPRGSGVVLASIPFFHVYGMTVALNYPFAAGATVIPQNRPDVEEILKLIGRYHPTEFPGVPALYQAINTHPRTPRHDFRSIKVCVSGSAPLPLEVARQFEKLTGVYLVEGYGLTEASPVTHANPIHGEVRKGSIGLPFPETSQRVVDLETGTRELGPGEVGELCVRGPQVMAGYYLQPEETALVLRGGWLFTGDIGYIDGDGYAYIVDRKKDLINVGGLKVYPREVEEVLYQHPGVQEAAVVGVPDAALGEVVRAFVVRRAGAAPTEAELIGFVREHIAHYKAPRSVEFRESLPRTAVQKVLRRALRSAPPSQSGDPTKMGPPRAL